MLETCVDGAWGYGGEMPDLYVKILNSVDGAFGGEPCVPMR